LVCSGRTVPLAPQNLHRSGRRSRSTDRRLSPPLPEDTNGVTMCRFWTTWPVTDHSSRTNTCN